MRPLVLAIGLVLLPSAGFAQTPAPTPLRPPADSRFTLRETPDGLVRLDGRTGQISVCKSENGSLTCKLAADDRAALEAEIERLRVENETLKRNGATAENRPGNRQENLNLPSDQEVDRALSLFERIWRRFMTIMRDTEQDQNGRL